MVATGRNREVRRAVGNGEFAFRRAEHGRGAWELEILSLASPCLSFPFYKMRIMRFLLQRAVMRNKQKTVCK